MENFEMYIEDAKAELFRRQKSTKKEVTISPEDTIAEFKTFDKCLDILKCSYGELTRGKPKMETTVLNRISDKLDAGAFKRWKWEQQQERLLCSNLIPISCPEDFKIRLDCTQFQQNEIKVVIEDNCVVVQGKHDYKLDEHGIVKREFSRSFPIPEGVNKKKFLCMLDQYGVLNIKAPYYPTVYKIPIQVQE